MLHPGAYLRISWNQLDLVIVVTSLAALYSSSSHLAMIKVLRLLRALRPLRMISRFKVRGWGRWTGTGIRDVAAEPAEYGQRNLAAMRSNISPLAVIDVLHLLLRAVLAAAGLPSPGLVEQGYVAWFALCVSC